MSANDFLEKQKKAALDFRAALSKETDRGCALFAAAYLDNALSDLLYCTLAYDKKIETDLFTGTAPLSSFSSRIKLAFYLGKISKVEKRDMELVRKVRNEFAHSADNISFETPKINSQCKELSFSYHESSHRARGHFTAACMGLLVNIQKETLSCQAPKIKDDNSPTEEQKATHRALIKDMAANGDSGKT